MELYTINNIFIKATDRFPPNFTGIAEWIGGIKIWYIDGKRHRIDGPAFECSSGHKRWFVNGKEVAEEQHNLLASIMKLKGLS